MRGKRVVVIGAGAIGCEMAEALSLTEAIVPSVAWTFDALLMPLPMWLVLVIAGWIFLRKPSRKRAC